MQARWPCAPAAARTWGRCPCDALLARLRGREARPGKRGLIFSTFQGGIHIAQETERQRTQRRDHRAGNPAGRRRRRAARHRAADADALTDGRSSGTRSGRDRADGASRRSAGSWTTASSSTARPRRQHEAKLKLKQIQVKEVKFRPGTDEGDYQIKLRNLIRFLEEGDKAKITLRFRGREMAHQEFGVRLLERMTERSRAATASSSSFRGSKGRQMVMLLAPKKGKKKEDKKAAPAPAKSATPSTSQ